MAFVDSSGWIAFFSASDTRHEEADALFRAALAGRVSLITTNLIAAEVHRFLLFRAGIAPARAALDRMQASPRVRWIFVNDDHHQAARRWLTKLDDQCITYTDATSFAVMQASCCDGVIGFDSDFVIAGFTLVRMGTREPP